MPDPNAGPATVEQPSNGTPEGQQQAQVNPQNPGTPPQEQPQQPTAEQFAQLQAQAARAADLEKQLQTTTESARYFQSQASRFQQALGIQPQQQPQDPAAGIAKMLFDEGLTEGAANGIAKAIHSTYAPLQQQLQQSQAALQGGLQVDSVMGQVYQANPALFSNPAVFESVKSQALTLAMQGGQIDPGFIEDLAAIASYRAGKQQPTNQPGVIPFNQNPAPAQPFANGMHGFRPTFQQPQQHVPKTLSPAAAALQAEAAKRYGQ